MSIFKMRAAGSVRLPDLTEVRRALAILADPENGCEIRGLPGGTSFVHKGDDLDGLCAAAQKLADRKGVYYALNPIPLNASRANSGNVLRRRWVLIDIDPKRPKDTNSTEEEHKAAKEVAALIIDYLMSVGWPAPLLVDSGNGWHVLFRIELQNDAESRELVRSFLVSLAQVFDNEQAHVGSECHDAPRISKLPGTWARKGPHTSERPHRQAKLVFAPEAPTAVAKEVIQQTIRLLEDRHNGIGEPRSGNEAPSAFVLRSNGADISAYGKAALENEIAKLILTTPGTESGGVGRNNQLFRSAAALAELVAGGVLNEADVERELISAACRIGLDNDPNCGSRGIQATIQSGFKHGRENPRTGPKNEKKSGNTSGTQQPPGDKPKWDRPAIYSLPEILSMEIPPPNWAVPGLLSEGLSILAGKPKLGKSWMALNLAMTIAAGGTALGMAKTEAGDVLYLSLEDRLRRVQDRSRKLLKGLDCTASGRLKISVLWPKQDRGGSEELYTWLEQAERPRLVIIDVWAKFRPSYKNGSQYEQDYESAAAVKSIADKYGVSLLILHHCKKAAAEDVVDEISGTLGLAGAADGLLVLTRARSETEGKLFITGRDVDEQELAVEFDPQTFAWKSLGKSEGRAESQVKAAILDTFRRMGGAEMFPSEMAKVIGKDAAVVKTTMWRMYKDGELMKKGHKYSWPLEDLAPTDEMAV